jgi:hypothetical protein
MKMIQKIKSFLLLVFLTVLLTKFFIFCDRFSILAISLFFSYSVPYWSLFHLHEIILIPTFVITSMITLNYCFE